MLRHLTSSGHSGLRVWGLVVCCGVAAAPFAAHAQPAITDLGTLMGTSNATGVNADGTTVVGTSEWVPLPGGTRPFKWTSGSGMVNLGTLGGIHSSGYAVSGDGLVVVGASETAFRWSPVMGMLSLGALPGGIGSIACGVSGDGSVICGMSSSSVGPRAFRWAGTLLEDLGVLTGGSSSWAYAVSADGSTVVGESDMPGGNWSGFRWTSGAGMVGLGTISGASAAYGSWAYGVNADGSVVVGKGGTPFGTRAFRWTSGGGMVSLGAFPGGTTTEARGVSGDGATVVGFGTTSLGPRAFLWTSALGLVDLNAYLPTLGVSLTGWTLEQARGISTDGKAVIGYGLHNGEMRAWLVTGLGVAPCYANCDASTTAPALNVNDFTCFLNRFAAGDSWANCDGSTALPVLNVNDFTCYLNAYAAGCLS